MRKKDEFIDSVLNFAFNAIFRKEIENSARVFFLDS